MQDIEFYIAISLRIQSFYQFHPWNQHVYDFVLHLTDFMGKYNTHT